MNIKKTFSFNLNSSITPKILLLFCFLFFSSCAMKEYDKMRETRIAIAPYIQPQNIAELFAGRLIPYSIKASEKELNHLNTLLEKTLKTKTHFDILQIKNIPSLKNRDHILKQWIDIGEQEGVDYIIVPYILEWRPAQQLQTKYIPDFVVIDYYLLSIKGKSLLARSRYFENQVIALDELRYRRVPNGIFYRTHITRFALAEDSILMMIEDFSLTTTALLEKTK